MLPSWELAPSNMAQQNPVNILPVLSGSKLLVTVLQALPDILLVAVDHEEKYFQGVLLDSSKGHLPCGIYPPDGCYPPPPDLSNTKLYSVKQRHSYFCTDSDVNAGPVETGGVPHGLGLLNRSKPTGRPSVRLRPRHVLCSNCRQVCNEKNERVRDNKAVPSEAAAKIPCTSAPKPGNSSTTVKKVDKSSSQSATHTSPQTSKTRSGLSIRNSNKQNLNTKNKPAAKNSDNPMNLSIPSNKIVNKTTATKSKETKSTGARATRRTVQQTPNLSTKTGKRKLDHIGGDSVLIPKVKKLKPSEIENANCNAAALCIAESSLKSNTSKKRAGQSNVHSSESRSVGKSASPNNGALNLVSDSSQKSHAGDSPGQIPKLRFSSVNNKIAKVTLSTSGKTSQSTKKKASKAAQSCHPTIPKMVLSKSASASATSSPSNSDKDASGQEPTVMSCANTTVRVTSAGPKVTILPLVSKVSNDPSMKEVEIHPKTEEEAVPASDQDTDSTNIIKHPAPLLKICIAPDGTGTIMEIPPKPELTVPSSSVEASDLNSNKQSDITAKAAKKALKRAKKEAQRKLLMSRGSPSYSLMGGMSPRYGGMSPLRLGGLSPGRSCWPSDRLGSKMGSKLSLSSPGRIGGSSPVRWNGTSPARLNCFSPSSRSEEKPPTSSAVWEPSLKENACEAQLSTSGSKKHKHKVKHKKKHKGDRKTKDTHISPCSIEAGKSSSTGVPAIVDGSDMNDSNDPEDPPQNSSLKQKLSLSIKRVKSDGCEYITRDCSSEESSCSFSSRGCDEKTSCQAKSSCDVVGIGKKLCMRRSSGESLSSNKGGFEGDSSDDQCDVPAFPPSLTTVASPLLDSHLWRDIECCHVRAPGKPSDAASAEGGALVCRLPLVPLEEGWISMAVGDVVWAKILGFPWWPAMVTHLRVRDLLSVQNPGRKSSNTSIPEHVPSGTESHVDNRKDFEAQVSWYGSATTSTLHPASLRPFILCFKQRYSKKKRGPYRSAVKEALRIAESKLSPDVALDLSIGGCRVNSLLCSNSPSTVPPVPTVPSNACDTSATVVSEQGSGAGTSDGHVTLLSSASCNFVSMSSTSASRSSGASPLNLSQNDEAELRAKDSVSLETCEPSVCEPCGDFVEANTGESAERDAVAREKTAPPIADTIDVSHLLKEANFSAYPKFTTSRISKTSPDPSQVTEDAPSTHSEVTSIPETTSSVAAQASSFRVIELESAVVAQPLEHQQQTDVHYESIHSIENTMSSPATGFRGPSLRVPTYPPSGPVSVVSPCSSPSSGVGMSGNGSPSSPHTVDVYS